MREKLFEVLKKIGASFSDEEKESGNDIDLTGYIQDSYIKILFALELEENLGIVLADDALKEENLKSFNRLVEVISKSEHI